MPKDGFYWARFNRAIIGGKKKCQWEPCRIGKEDGTTYAYRIEDGHRWSWNYIEEIGPKMEPRR